MDYKEAGVDVEKGDLFVNNIKRFIKNTYNQNVVSGVGGFAALYDIGGGRYLASGTDGVGTKLKLAQDLNRHDTIGQDLVAMCVNDILCTGARPLFFLDYLATGKLDLYAHEQIVKGIADACIESGCVLIGGETAEMPGFYQGNKYDLAGFAVGDVYKEDLITGKDIKDGDSIVGLASSGFHSNGYSLVRKIIGEDRKLKMECLTPTTLYVKTIQRILRTNRSLIKGIAHITGGGFNNIPRINSNFGYDISKLPKANEIPEHISYVTKLSKLSDTELYKTFNMGVGLVIVTSDEKALMKEIGEEHRSWVLGKVSKKIKGVNLKGKSL